MGIVQAIPWYETGGRRAGYFHQAQGETMKIELVTPEAGFYVLWTDGALDEARMLAQFGFDERKDRENKSSGYPYYAGSRRLARLFPLSCGTGFGWGICFGASYREPTTEEYQKLCRHLLEHDAELFYRCGFTGEDSGGFKMPNSFAPISLWMP